MEETVKAFEKETGVSVVRKEVWHDKENLRELSAIDSGDKCGGVPFLYNDENKKWLCGAVPIEELKAWAV